VLQARPAKPGPRVTRLVELAEMFDGQTPQPRAVSVCIPVLNAERFLSASLETVLAQTYPLQEIIICDDCSTDATPRIADDFAARDARVRVVRPPPEAGRAFAALNWAIKQTSGEFVAVYHAGDLYDPTIVERQTAYLERHPEAGAAFALPRFLDEHGRVIGKATLPPELRNIDAIDCRTLTEVMLVYKNVFLAGPSEMMRRTAFDLVGGFDQEAYGAQADGEMWLRMSRQFQIGIVHEHLFGSRSRPAQRSQRINTIRTTRSPYFRMMEGHLSQPGVRKGVSARALGRFQVWEAKDDTERAANAVVLGDSVQALALLRGSLVRPLLKSRDALLVARILALKAVSYAGAHAGGKVAREAVYIARFGRRMPPGLKPIATQVFSSLRENGSPRRERLPERSNGKKTAITHVFVDPFSYHFLGNALFDVQSKWNRDGSLRPWILLRERLAQEGMSLDTADYLEADSSSPRAVYSSFGILTRFKKLATRGNLLFNAFYMFETVMYARDMYAMAPQLADRFRTLYSWTDAATLASVSTRTFPFKPFRMPSPFSDVIDSCWKREDRKGVILVNTNRRGIPMHGDLFDERMKATVHFARSGPFDLWGRWWNDTANFPAEWAEAVERSWRGPLSDKYEAYSKALFVVCYENQILPGWITEKIFDCFRAGAIPLYLGAPDVEKWIPSDCFVDVRKFATYEDLSRFLANMTPEEIRRYRIAARDFFRSDAFRPFSAEFFAERFVDDVRLQLRESQSRGGAN
jgi:alpha(1,3/1,4) fucosyltransferase